MEKISNFLVATENRPYLIIDGLPGIGIKPMNTLEKPLVWSAIIRIEAGPVLPKRQHTALCEVLIVKGKGRYATGQAFTGGDYLRETAGDYVQIEVEEELVFFVTHHGDCTFLTSDGSVIFVAGLRQIEELQKPPERST